MVIRAGHLRRLIRTFVVVVVATLRKRRNQSGPGKRPNRYPLRFSFVFFVFVLPPNFSSTNGLRFLRNLTTTTTTTKEDGVAFGESSGAFYLVYLVLFYRVKKIAWSEKKKKKWKWNFTTKETRIRFIKKKIKKGLPMPFIDWLSAAVDWASIKFE